MDIIGKQFHWKIMMSKLCAIFTLITVLINRITVWKGKITYWMCIIKCRLNVIILISFKRLWRGELHQIVSQNDHPYEDSGILLTLIEHSFH